MKERFKTVLVIALGQFLATAVMSGFLTLIFRDPRRGPMGEYLIGYLGPRFLDLYMVFVPGQLILAVLILAGWLLYELSRVR